MLFEFRRSPLVATILKLDDQAYELRGSMPHTRKDGRVTQLLVWETSCPSCGAGFEAMTGLTAKDIVRRCSACRDSRKLVKGRRGRKLKVQIIEP